MQRGEEHRTPSKAEEASGPTGQGQTLGKPRVQDSRQDKSNGPINPHRISTHAKAALFEGCSSSIGRGFSQPCKMSPEPCVCEIWGDMGVCITAENLSSISESCLCFRKAWPITNENWPIFALLKADVSQFGSIPTLKTRNSSTSLLIRLTKEHRKCCCIR